MARVPLEERLGSVLFSQRGDSFSFVLARLLDFIDVVVGGGGSGG